MIYAMSDIHGHYEAMKKRMEQMRPLLQKGNSRLILLGDYIDRGGIIELVYIVLQSVVKPGITGFFKIDLHIKCYIYLS